MFSAISQEKRIYSTIYHKITDVTYFSIMKKTVKQNITEIRRIAKNMPKTINEAVYEDFQELGDEDPKKRMLAPEVPADDQQRPAPVAPEENPQAPEAPMAGAEAAEGGAMGAGAAPAGDMGEESDGEDALNVEQFVDDIRKKSLRGMAQLAENPDDERYQLLKKIWQICDKKPEQQTAFSNPNNPVAQKKM